MPTIPTTEPTQIIAGDTCVWTRSLPDYPADQGWSLAYKLLSLDAAAAAISISSTAQGSDHLLSSPASTTADWKPGTYRYQLAASKRDEKYTLATGTIEILPAFGANGLAALTHNEKCLAGLTAVLEGDLANPLAEYKIEGREAKRWGRGELVRLRAHYQRLVDAERGNGLGVRVIRTELCRG